MPRSAAEDSLEELLHRCHRDELQPLARLVQVDGRDLGLSDLARVLAAALCRLGSHAVSNALRGGAGLPYPQVLARAAARYGIEPAPTLEMEQALVRAHFQGQWARLDAASRARFWKELGLDAPAPDDGPGALDAAFRRFGGGLDYAITQTVEVVRTPTGTLALLLLNLSPLGCLFRFLAAPLIPFFFWWKLRPEPERLLAGVLEVARLRQVVLHRVTIGVVGSPSTGKDAGIKALFGIDSGNISPIAGSTKEVAIQKLPGSTALYVVNTPGMGDVVERVTEEARQVLDHIDVFLYVVNAEGGVQARELADYQRCRATGKPVLVVVNKVDVLRPRDREAYLADARAKLSAPPEDFLPVAFDPLPQLAPGPIGMEAVHTWLREHLAELGKNPDELPPLPTRAAPAVGSPAAPPEPP